MKNSRFILLTVLSGVLVSGLFSSTAFAQACPSAEELLFCAHTSLESCRSSASCEGDRTQAQSCQDMVEATAERCCSKPTAKKRRNCINRDRRKFNRGIQFVPPNVKALLRTCRNAVKQLRTNGCDTGSLGDI